MAYNSLYLVFLDRRRIVVNFFFSSSGKIYFESAKTNSTSLRAAVTVFAHFEGLEVVDVFEVPKPASKQIFV